MTIQMMTTITSQVTSEKRHRSEIVQKKGFCHQNRQQKYVPYIYLHFCTEIRWIF